MTADLRTARLAVGSDPRTYSVLSREFIGNSEGHVSAIKTVQVTVEDGRLQVHFPRVQTFHLITSS